MAKPLVTGQSRSFMRRLSGQVITALLARSISSSRSSFHPSCQIRLLTSKMQEPSHFDDRVSRQTDGVDASPSEFNTGPDAPLSKKAAKKAEKNAAKEAKKAARTAEIESQRAVTETRVESINDGLYGYLPLCNSKITTGRKFTLVEALDEKVKGTDVWLRCRLQESRCKGSLGFLVLREKIATVQAVIAVATVGKDAVKWTAGIPLESIVDVYGEVTVPVVPVEATTQKVEIQVKKIFCVNKAAPELPFQLKDASRPDNAAQEEGAVVVHQDTRLDNRILDLRTVTNQSIFRIQSAVCRYFRDYLHNEGFTEIHTPKLLGGASEGGANVFSLSYFGRNACLAQSPQLHKQMAICADLDRVFEIGPVFRAENSNTHRHLCEFTGLDFEMNIKEHYNEILDVLDAVFQHIFRSLNEQMRCEIDRVMAQHPARPFQWIARAPRIPFAEGIQMLRDAGATGIPEDISEFDLSTELEKTLGKLVFDKYRTDFYMLVRYPLKVRPFYTMPDPDDDTWSNSYDVFMRGEEIVSGAQRVHDVPLLIERTKACGIPPDSIKTYIDSFSLGAYPHGGVGIGLERVVMLFLGLPNIRKTCLFPRDPKRLTP